jgi:hypothetical protein
MAFRDNLPRRTIRLRLTLLYGGLFLLSGAALLAITYLLVVNATSGCISNNQNGVSAFVCRPDHAGAAFGYTPNGVWRKAFHAQIASSTTHGPPRGAPNPNQLEAQAKRQHASTLHQLLIQSGLALALMSLASRAPTTSSRNWATRSTSSSPVWPLRSRHSDGSSRTPRTSCARRSP